MIRYLITIFLSAFLLFQVQPIVARFVLPWFGGSAAVWNTCMLFFQVALLAGYCYSHLVTKWLQPRQQWILHIILLAISAFFLPVQPAEFWKPQGNESITIAILALLAASIGLPFLMLSTTGPLIQAWQSRTHPSFPTYRMFALSNTGSLLALLSYPFLIEPFLTRVQQSWIWSGGYITFALLCCYSGWQIFGLGKTGSSPAPDESDGAATEQNISNEGLPAKHGNPDESVLPAERESGREKEAIGGTRAVASVPETESDSPGLGLCVLWMLLAAAASAMLLATTNQMCQEVASVPFLWILPLSLYLVTFIISFDSPRWYQQWFFLPMLIISIFLGAFLLLAGLNTPLPLQVAGYAFVMFFCCMSCHGELAQMKPATSYLTLFYLMISVGGALGGLFIVLVAPNIFKGYHEFHLLLIMCGVLCTGVYYLNRLSHGKPIPLASWLALPAVVTASVLVFVQFQTEFESTENLEIIYKARNSYGTVTIKERRDSETGEPKRLILYNGRIKHGMEMLTTDLVNQPLSYYSTPSGVGRSVLYKRGVAGEQKIKIGVIGLGTGTMASWCRPQDEVVFYEINPQVKDVAENVFSYLQRLEQSGGQVRIEMGDARIRLEHQIQDQQLQQFDVLVVDAFSSDAIPVHLLTLESLDIYMQHLKEDGILAVHISNRYLNLEPICYNLAQARGLKSRLVRNNNDDELEIDASSWVLITRDGQFVDWLEDFQYSKSWETAMKTWSAGAKETMWTDDFINLVSIIEWNVVETVKAKFDEFREEWFPARDDDEPADPDN